MSAYEELVERIAIMTDQHHSGHWPLDIAFAQRVLAEVLRKLETVTPEIVEEFNRASIMGGIWTIESVVKEFLRASPLEPPK